MELDQSAPTGDSRLPAGRPGFLLSSERSGSNLVRSILHTHQDISAPHPFETAYPWENLASPAKLSRRKRRKLIRDILINKRYSHHPLTVGLRLESLVQFVEAEEDPSFLTIQEAFYRECCRLEDTSLWVSKYPGLWECIEWVMDHYGSAKVIYLVRDPRDVVLSFKTSNIDLYHPYFSAQRWQTEQEKGRQLLEQFPDRVHLLRYEDLLRTPEEEVETLCQFLGMEFQERMLYYYETEDAQATSRSSELFENLSVPIKSDNFGKFRDRLPDDEVRLTEHITADLLEYFDYERVYSKAELDRFTPESERYYRRQDAKLGRKAALKYWIETPREQLTRQLTTSFTAYMYLRYGMLA